ncbi:MAG: C25 family cysteine peptidase [Gaiellaceae bacterium]
MRKVLGGSLVALAACALAGPSLAATPREQQFSLAGQAAVKLLVAEEGWYRVTRKRLVAAGLPASAAPARLQLYADGKQVPIRATKAAIEFYGVPLDTVTTNKQTYWLIAGAKPGLRIRTVAGGVAAGPVARTFPATARSAPREIYVSSIHNGEAGNVFGPAVRAGAETVVKLALTRPALKRPASIAVALTGFSLLPHKTRVRVNGTVVGTVDFARQVRSVGTFAVPAGVLKEGTNTVGLQSTAGELDISVLDSVEIRYERGVVADRNVLDFVLRSGQRARIEGFTGRAVQVVDVTRPAAPVVLRPTITRTAAGYRATVGSTFRQRHLIAFLQGKQLTALDLVRNRASKLNAANQGADLVIVTHQSLGAALPPLVAARQAEGLRVAVVDVEDVYDEFAFGAHGPQPIKDFLDWTRTRWNPAPRFVLLVGDATHDPRDELGKGEFDLVPTRFVDTVYLETASDDWMADFNDDGIPELGVGRLPVRTLEQARGVIAKIVRYVAEGPSASRQMLLVSDKPIDYDFEAASRTLYGLIPSTWTTAAVNRREGPNDAAVRARLLAALNQGPSLVNFFGHGSIEIWTSGSILRPVDALALRNSRLSLYVMMTCLNGYFTDVEVKSLGEALLENPLGGAVAVWSSTGETVLSPQLSMDQKALELLFANPRTRLGEAMVQAKGVISDLDVRRTWVLFGDPTTRLHI